jgi:hypothetical protein
MGVPRKSDSWQGRDSHLADTTLLNVAIVPPRSVAAAIHAMSGALAASGDGLFVVDGVERLAHVTVYMARFPTDTVAEILDRLERLDIHPVDIKHSGYFVTAGNYYEVSYQRTAELELLQSTIIGRLKDLRFAPGDPERETFFGPYSADQRASAEACGYDLSGNLFRPHVTLSQLRGTPRPRLPESPDELSFVANTLALFEADEFGAARRLIATRSADRVARGTPRRAAAGQ